MQHSHNDFLTQSQFNYSVGNFITLFNTVFDCVLLSNSVARFDFSFQIKKKKNNKSLICFCFSFQSSFIAKLKGSQGRMIYFSE